MEGSTNPKVSICIPVWNGALFIRRAIDSCLGQTHKNIEVVVVDDESTDATAEIIKEYQAKDPRVKYFKNEKNMGLTPNWHRAISLATGEYAEILCADDWLDPNYVAVKLKALKEHPEVAFVESGSCTYRENEKGEFMQTDRNVKPERVYSSDYVLKNFYRDNGLIGSFSLARTKDLQEHFRTQFPNRWGYDELYRKGKIIDNFAFLSMLPKYGYMYYTDKTVHRVLAHAGQASKRFGLKETKIADNIRAVHVDVVGFEYLFKEKAPRWLSPFRVYTGANVLASVAFDLLLRRASGPFKGELRNFFSPYTFFEKTKTLLLAPYYFAKRVAQWLLRRFTRPKFL